MPINIPDYAQFAAIRKYDIHTGIDLHCEEGTEVYAIEDGRILDCDFFTGPEANSEWWESTKYVGVFGKSGYIIYGEIEPAEEWKRFSFVSSKLFIIKEGDLIGRVKRVLKEDKGKPTCMLHLELYSDWYGSNLPPVEWKLNEPQPKYLLNPNILLKDLK